MFALSSQDALHRGDTRLRSATAEPHPPLQRHWTAGCSFPRAIGRSPYLMFCETGRCGRWSVGGPADWSTSSISRVA
jgi:hypothetical protein